MNDVSAAVRATLERESEGGKVPEHGCDQPAGCIVPDADGAVDRRCNQTLAASLDRIQHVAADIIAPIKCPNEQAIAARPIDIPA